MKDYNEVYKILREHHTVKAKPRLIAEFNHNRYSEPEALNVPEADEDSQNPDIYDIDSIVEGRRPGAGIIKARVGEMRVGEDYDVAPDGARYYIAQPEDTYKYWASSNQAGAATFLPKYTNLATNPSFERGSTTSGNTEWFRNLAYDPRATIASGNAANAAWRTVRWFGGTGTGTYAVVKNASDGPLPGLDSYFRKTWNTTATSTGDTGFDHAGSFPVIGGETYTFSVYLRTNRGGKQGNIWIDWKNASGTRVSFVQPVTVTMVANEWQRLSCTVTAPIDATQISLVSDVEAGSVFQPGDTVDGTGLMITKTPYLLPYFDGQTVNDHKDSPFGVGFSYAWAGTENASQTIVTGPRGENEIVRNLVSNPELGVNDTGWSVTGGTGAVAVAQRLRDATSPFGRYYYNVQWTTIPSSMTNVGINFGNIDNLVVGGDTYCATQRVFSSTGGNFVLVYDYYNATDNYVTAQTKSFTLAPNTWTEVVMGPVMMTPGTTKIRPHIRFASGKNIVANERLAATMVSITKTVAPAPYFSGSFVVPGERWADPDFTPRWAGSGTAHNNPSVIHTLSSAGTVGAAGAAKCFISFNKGVSVGKKALRIMTIGTSQDSYVGVAIEGGWQPNKTYTAMARSYQTESIDFATGGNNPRGMWAVGTTAGGQISYNVKSTPGPNAAGWTDHRIVFTVTADSSPGGRSLRLINGGAPFTDDIWWDDVVVVEGVYNGPYFNGDTPDPIGGGKYGWTGTAHASTSSYLISTSPFSTGTDVYPTNVNPQVTYPSLVKTNKIVIGLENTFSSPENYEIYVQTIADGQWTRIKSNPDDDLVINDDGQIILYWNGTDWTQDRKITEYTELAGIQLRVQSMNTPNSYFNLIEMGLRLEWDMTSYLLNVSDTFDLGDATTLNPIGDATSNVADINLFNHYHNGFLFSDENENSLFRGLMEENVKFVLDYIYDTSDISNVPIPEVAIRQFEMYSTGHWSAQGMPQASVNLRDSSKFLQETKCRPVLYENKTVSGIIYRLLDSVGFDRYDIGKLGKQLVDGVWVDINIETSSLVVPYFWVDAETTVWDAIQELASGTQTAIYFDEWDRLQVLTREQAFANTTGKVWTLRGNTSDKELPDIIEYSMEDAEVTNDVTVNYQTTQFEEYVQGSRRNSIIWQPEDDVVYAKSSDLQLDLLKNGASLRLTPADAALWPFESMMMVDAEMISYKGKQYTYYPSTSNVIANVISNPVTVWLESYDDYKKYHYDLTPIQNRYLNKFTGNIRITERGVWNTPVQDHRVETLAQYTQRNVRGGSAYKDLNGFYKSKPRLALYKKKYTTARKAYLKNKTAANKKKMASASAAYKTYAKLYSTYKNASVTDGVSVPAEKATVQLKTSSVYQSDHYLMATRGSTSDLGYKWYGTSIRFNADASAIHQNAGIAFQNQASATDAAGYRAEISQKGGKGGVGRVNLYRTDSSGKIIWVRSVDMIVLPNKWYNLDLEVQGIESSSSFIFNVWVNGTLMLTHSASGAQKIAYTGRFGLYARGRTNASFEYLYAIGAYTSGNWPSNFASYDRLNKGFASARFSDFASGKIDMKVRRKIKKKMKTVPVKYQRFFFDEFGPICHEIRKFDVKYDTSGMPVVAPFPYYTNTGMADIYEWTGDAYGATVYMINAARQDAALQGTDDNHQFCMYGLVLKQQDVQTVHTENKSSIAAIGLKQLTVDSKWIQTKEMAQALADWIRDHWGKATDTLSVTIFGNPLIEVGDVVAMDVESANIHEETHKYFVLSTSSSFSDGGLETTLRLRRARN